MSSNKKKTNDVNESRLSEQGFSSGRCSWQGNIGRHHANPVISKRRKWTSQENKIVMECYLLSEPKIRGYRKRMLTLWLQTGALGFPDISPTDISPTNTSRQTFPRPETSPMDTFLTRHIPDGYFPNQTHPRWTLPRPDTSPTDTYPTRHIPDRHFPDQMPDRYFPE